MVGPPELEAKLRAAWPPEAWRDVTVVLAVSGGADSTALLRAAARLKAGGCGRLVGGHFKHGIRPSGEEDERFVAAVCESLDIPFEIRRGDVAAGAANEGDGIESAARRARYEFLAAVAEQHGARLVATAHTADDQAETILHHIVRGTGLTGLSGMPRSRPLSPAVSLLRPLLSIRRAEVVEYLAQIGQTHREDESNRDVKFMRNRIRHELLPLLGADYNPEIVNALLRLGQLAGDAQESIGGLVAARFADTVSLSKDSAVVECGPLGDAPAYLVSELLIEVWRAMRWSLQSMGFDQWHSLSNCIRSAADGQFSLPGSIRAKKKDGQLVLTRPQ